MAKWETAFIAHDPQHIAEKTTHQYRDHIARRDHILAVIECLSTATKIADQHLDQPSITDAIMALHEQIYATLPTVCDYCDDDEPKHAEWQRWAAFEFNTPDQRRTERVCWDHYHLYGYDFERDGWEETDIQHEWGLHD